MPDISICMITYNHEAFISKAIEGVLMQKTAFSYELVIGEDGSTDNTRKICEIYQAKYPDKIKLLPFTGNKGMSGNYIATLKACTGKFIALCEGDDYWTDPAKLEKQAKFLFENPGYNLCFHDVYNELNGKKTKSSIWDAPETSDLDHLLSNRGYIKTLSVMFRNADGIIDFIRSAKDSPFLDLITYVVVTGSGRIRFFKEKMAVYRIHQGGVWSGTSGKQIAEKTVAGYKILYKLLPPEKQQLLKSRYMMVIEDHLLANAGDGPADIAVFKNDVIEIEDHVFLFLQNSCRERKKVSFYATSVPLGTMAKAIIKKIKQKLF